MLRGIIYMYTAPNGKVYVGQTINERSRRFCWFNTNHPYAGAILENARKKYHPSLWSYRILAVVYSTFRRDMGIWLNAMERYYIWFFHSSDLRYGYNSDSGGGFMHAVNGAKISISARERCADKSYRLKLSCAHGVDGVVQYDLDGGFVAEYPCIEDAVAAVGLSRASIQLACQGVRLTGGSFQWRYIGSVRPVTYISFEDRVKHRLVSILEYSLSGELLASHVSILAAAGSDDRHKRRLITQCCRGIRLHALGRIWRYSGSDIPVLRN